MNSGKVPVNVLKRSVLRQLKNKRTEIANSAGLGADCAVFAPFSEGQLVTCVQEGVVELQCENDLAEAEREDLSVMPMRRIFQKCANNLAAAGAEPVAAEPGWMRWRILFPAIMSPSFPVPTRGRCWALPSGKLVIDKLPEMC